MTNCGFCTPLSSFSWLSVSFWLTAARTAFYPQLKRQARFFRFIWGLKLIGYAIAVHLTWGKTLARCRQKLDKTYSQW